MKRLWPLLLLALVLMVSCIQEHPGQQLEKLLNERFDEGGDRLVLVEELVEAPWDSVWFVDKTQEDSILPDELEGLPLSDEARLVVIKDGNFEPLELPDNVIFKYSDFVIVNAFQVYNDTEFSVDRIDGKLRLYYYEDCNI